MWIKNYTAASVREALAKVKKEMGSSAVILDTRVENGLTSRSSGPGSRVTITAGCDEPENKPAGATHIEDVEGPKKLILKGDFSEAAESQAPDEGEKDEPATDRESTGIEEQIADLRNVLTDRSAVSGPREFRRYPEWFIDPNVGQWLRTEPRLKDELTDAYVAHLLDQSPDPDPFLKRSTLPPVVSFVGPPGAGTSTMLINCLAQWWRDRKAAPTIIEIISDHGPSGGRLASWAELFELQYERFYFDEISRIKRYIGKIKDQPVFARCGYPTENDGGHRIIKRLTKCLDAKITVLVLSALFRGPANERFVERFRPFAPMHLGISLWDEWQPWAEIRALSAAAQLPLCYCLRGAAPCDQIEPVTNATLRAGLADELFRESSQGGRQHTIEKANERR